MFSVTLCWSESSCICDSPFLAKEEEGGQTTYSWLIPLLESPSPQSFEKKTTEKANIVGLCKILKYSTKNICVMIIIL